LAGEKKRANKRSKGRRKKGDEAQPFDITCDALQRKKKKKRKRKGEERKKEDDITNCYLVFVWKEGDRRERKKGEEGKKRERKKGEL